MKPRTGLALLVVLLFALLPASAAAYEPFAAAPNLPEPVSLGAQSSRAHGLAFGPGGKLWFAGSATNYGPAFGFAGLVEGSQVNRPGAKAIEAQGPLYGIAAGPDGNLWMTTSREDGESAILRVTPSGLLTSFPVGGAGTATASLRWPSSIVAGPDGSLWFTAPAGDAIGRITTSGEITAFPLDAGAHPESITVGAEGKLWFTEGKLWFTEAGLGRIGSITTGGTIATYALPEPGVKPNQITLGPAGDLWFTESSGGSIGKITPEGKVTEFQVEDAGPIAYGPRGLLWFGSVNGIGSISPNGVVGSHFCFDECQAKVEALALAPDGALWYAERPVAHGGGGGNAAFTETLAGTVGEWQPPAPTVLIAPKVEPAGRTGLRVTASCGSVAEGRCQGTLRLKLGGRLVGSNGFLMRDGSSRVVRVQLSTALRRVLHRRRTVRGRALVSIAGRREAGQPVTLQWPRNHGGQARRG